MTTQPSIKPKKSPSDPGYADDVYRFLQNTPFGKSFTIDVIVEKENQERWIEIVKEYMAMTPWQGGWEFNTDYTKLRRIDYRFPERRPLVGKKERI